MFRNYLAAALRSLARNRLYAGINIIGLAIGLAAVLLITLFVRDELSYDRFVPESERSYLMTYEASIPGRSMMTGSRLPPELATPLKSEMPGIEAVARLSDADRVLLRHGDNSGNNGVIPKPIYREFINQRVQQLYLDVGRQSQLFSAFAIIALCIACLGLFGLSAFIAERRTKEIGIRKATGASTGDVMRLLLWQSTQPVLWANLIAWPVAGLVMNRWLQGFAYRVDLEPWLFFTTTTLVLIVALLTVSRHCYLVAREKPIRALRYE